jgi:cytochrome c oxidase cbb3-type subunit 4
METGMGLARSIVTVMAFVTFIGIVLWAWSGARRERFDAAARLPLEDDEPERLSIAHARAADDEEKMK